MGLSLCFLITDPTRPTNLDLINDLIVRTVLLFEKFDILSVEFNKELLVMTPTLIWFSCF